MPPINVYETMSLDFVSWVTAPRQGFKIHEIKRETTGRSRFFILDPDRQCERLAAEYLRTSDRETLQNRDSIVKTIKAISKTV